MKLNTFFLFFSTFLLLPYFLVYSQNKEIKIPIDSKNAANLSVFECKNSNLLLTYKDVHLKIKGETKYLEIDSLGQIIQSNQDKNIYYSLGMAEFDSSYIILSLSPENVNTSVFTKLAFEKNYILTKLTKDSLKVKNIDLLKYIFNKKPELRKSFSSNITAFCRNNIIYVVSISKNLLTIVKLKNKEVIYQQVSIENYPFNRELQKRSFSFYDSEKTLSVFDNISNNKLFINKQDDLIFLYKASKSINKQGVSNVIKSYNYLKINFQEKSYSNKEIIIDNDQSDAMYFDEKIWLCSSSFIQFQLAVYDLNKPQNHKTLFINKKTKDDQVLSNAYNFYSDNGKEKITSIENLLKNLTTKNKLSIGYTQWPIGISVYKDSLSNYFIEVASVTLDNGINPYIWNNKFNIYNFYKFHIYPPFMQPTIPSIKGFKHNNYFKYCSNNTISNNWALCVAKINQKWSSYFTISMDSLLNISSYQNNTINVEKELLDMKHFKDHLKAEFNNSKPISLFELKSKNKNLLFYTTKDDKNNIYMFFK